MNISDAIRGWLAQLPLNMTVVMCAPGCELLVRGRFISAADLFVTLEIPSYERNPKCSNPVRLKVQMSKLFCSVESCSEYKNTF